ncbi:MAG: histidinol-phosphate transaminase [Cryobacterium sp.]|nr:histidinol-phosphate transaminase [Oligoflexia bacterium]
MSFPLAPAYIRNLAPYVPGKPIEETQREYKIKNVVKLASNENPLGPSPKALKLLRKKILDLHRYPDASGFHLKAAISKHLKLGTEKIIIGNGSNEVIDLLIRTYCVPGDAIVNSRAAFIAYRICAQIQGVTTLESKLTSDLRTDLKDMAEVVRKNPRVKMVFIANPNNPTGTYNTKSELRAFLSEMKEIRGGTVLVVLDYAYWEYVTAADLPEPVSLMKDYPSMMILRTFSKIYGLAGLRVGYGISAPEIISTVEKTRQPFNLNSPALAAAAESLGDVAFVKRARRANDDGMKLWKKALERMGIPYWPSQGNFILLNTSEGFGRTGVDVFESCLRRGVIFRPVANYGLTHALRISIGTKAENTVAIRALEKELPADRKLIAPARRKTSSRSRA